MVKEYITAKVIVNAHHALVDFFLENTLFRRCILRSRFGSSGMYFRLLPCLDSSFLCDPNLHQTLLILFLSSGDAGSALDNEVLINRRQFQDGITGTNLLKFLQVDFGLRSVSVRLKG